MVHSATSGRPGLLNTISAGSTAGTSPRPKDTLAKEDLPPTLNAKHRKWLDRDGTVAICEMKWTCMARISASVGEGGVNRRQDVVTVQTLLNLNIGHLTPLR